jgi:hypothetical protein
MLVLGLILFVFGAVRLFILFYEWKRDSRIYREGTTARAVVDDRVTYPSEDDLQSSQYKLIAKFTDENGHEHYAKTRGHVCGAESRELMGTGFDVVYLPEDPERALFLVDRKKHVSIWGAAVYGIITMMGFLYLLGLILS